MWQMWLLAHNGILGSIINPKGFAQRLDVLRAISSANSSMDPTVRLKGAAEIMSRLECVELQVLLRSYDDVWRYVLK
jgi:hypothetical protein